MSRRIRVPSMDADIAVQVEAHNVLETSHDDIRTQLSAIDAQLAEKVQNFKLKNEIVNGDFSQGATGWNKTINCTFVVNNGIAEITASAVNNGIFKNIVGATNNIFYISSKIQSTSTQVGVYNFTSGSFSPSDGSNQMKLISLRSFIQTNSNIGVADLRTSGWNMFKADNFIIINLTSVFGTGNEPTKLEMDELMKVIPNGWWDGELSLTQKQLVTWQLNLIRKNTNAIIALGGTII